MKRGVPITAFVAQGVVLGVVLGFAASAQAATGVAPPVMYPATLWQGRMQAVVRVLDRLDGHIEVLTVPVGGTGTYRSLSVGVEACVSRPQSLATDAGALLHLKDASDPARPPFDGWMMAAEPSVAVYGSPLYDVRVISCSGEPTTPQAGPMPVSKAPLLISSFVPVEEGGEPPTPLGSASGGPVPLAPDSNAPIPLAPPGGGAQSLLPPSVPLAPQASPRPAAPASPGLTPGRGQEPTQAPLAPPEADPGLE